MKRTYQKMIQYINQYMECVGRVLSTMCDADLPKQELKCEWELDSKQIYERRKFGTMSPRPLEGIEAKL